jgi:hypothetical protein
MEVNGIVVQIGATGAAFKDDWSAVCAEGGTGEAKHRRVFGDAEQRCFLVVGGSRTDGVVGLEESNAEDSLEGGIQGLLK